MKPLGTWLADLTLLLVGLILAIPALFVLLIFWTLLFLTGHPSMTRNQPDDVV